MGTEEALHGAFIQSPNGQWLRDLVSAASANATGISYTIKANANWYWGGKKVPVTYRDFVYTVQQIDNPNNQLADRSGYANLDPTRYTHIGLKRVKFFWRTRGCTADFPCGPYGDWQSLFSSLYPSFALRGLDFNKIWTACICGSDGRPVANGPYFVSNYTKGQGSVLEANPFWAGKKPSIAEIEFKILPDTSSEVQAMQARQVDAIAPTFGEYLLQLKNAVGITFLETPGYYVEHLEFREGDSPAGPGVTGGASNALLRAPFIRQAISMAIDRNAIIDAVYGDLSDGNTPMNNAIFYATEAGYKPDFARWNFNPRKALALMAKHCTGGPTSVDPANTKTWECSGLPATFNWSWPSGDTTRAVTEAISEAELRAIGIQVVNRPLQPNIFFGPTGVESGNYDIAAFAEITSGDPGDWFYAYRCGGAVNYTGFCSRKVDALLAKGEREPNPSTRARDFEAADASLSDSVPVLPLYERPDVLVHVSALHGMVDSAGEGGPFWNIEDWKWGAA